jgi:hypothetical protein
MAPEKKNESYVDVLMQLKEVIGAFDLFRHHDKLTFDVVLHEGQVVVVQMEARFCFTRCACKPERPESSSEMRDLVNQAAAQLDLAPLRFGEVACHLESGNFSHADFTLRYREPRSTRGTRRARNQTRGTRSKKTMTSSAGER